MPEAVAEGTQLNQTQLRLITGDITDLEIEAFVFYAESNLAVGSGYGTAISVRGGPSIQKELDELREMARALDEFTVDGIRHNIPFLATIMQHPRWASGDLSTNFIAEEFPEGFMPREADDAELEALASIAASIDRLSNERRRQISGQMLGVPVSFSDKRIAVIGKKQVPLKIAGQFGAPFTVTFGVNENGNGRSVSVSSDWWPGRSLWRGHVDGVPYAAQVRPILNGVELGHAGIVAEARVYTEREAAMLALMPEKKNSDSSKALRCPMPGLVRAIHVAEGAEVQPGQQLCTVEAMKMENILRAERQATVKAIKAKEGDSLAVDAVIMEFA